MRYLDGESSPEEVQSIEARLAHSTELARELAIYKTLKQDLGSLTSDTEIRDSVWDRVNRGVARPTGWILLLVGLVAWAGYATWLFATTPIPPFEKLAVAAVVIGLLLLLVSVCWEHFRAWQIDPYRDVHR